MLRYMYYNTFIAPVHVYCISVYVSTCIHGLTNLPINCSVDLPHRMAIPLFLKNFALAFHENPEENRWYMKTLDRSKECLLFIKSMHIKFSKNFYKFMENVVEEDNCVQLPRQVHCRTEALHFGNTSSMMACTVTDQSDTSKAELLKVVITHVLVNKKTRRPMSYNSVLKMPERSYPVLEKIPTHTFEDPPANLLPEREHRVIDFDIDGNKHTNIMVYIQMCNEAMEERLRGKGSPIGQLQVEEFVLSFHQESMLGDVLQVVTWESVQSPATLHGQVRKGSVLLARCKMVHTKAYTTSAHL